MRERGIGSCQVKISTCKFTWKLHSEILEPFQVESSGETFHKRKLSIKYHRRKKNVHISFLKTTTG